MFSHWVYLNVRLRINSDDMELCCFLQPRSSFICLSHLLGNDIIVFSNSFIIVSAAFSSHFYTALVSRNAAENEPRISFFPSGGGVYYIRLLWFNCLNLTLSSSCTY